MHWPAQPPKQVRSCRRCHDRRTESGTWPKKATWATQEPAGNTSSSTTTMRWRSETPSFNSTNVTSPKLIKCSLRDTLTIASDHARYAVTGLRVEITKNCSSDWQFSALRRRTQRDSCHWRPTPTGTTCCEFVSGTLICSQFSMSPWKERLFVH